MHFPWREKQQIDSMTDAAIIETANLKYHSLSAAHPLKQSLALSDETSAIARISHGPMDAAISSNLNPDSETTELKTNEADESQQYFQHDSDQEETEPMEYEYPNLEDDLNHRENESKINQTILLELSSSDSTSQTDTVANNISILSYRESFHIYQTFVSNQVQIVQDRIASSRESLMIGPSENSSINSTARIKMEKQFLSNFSRLNYKQKMAFRMIQNHLSTGEQLMMIITGPGGTGKSFLIQTIVMYTKLYFENGLGNFGPAVVAVKINFRRDKE